MESIVYCKIRCDLREFRHIARNVILECLHYARIVISHYIPRDSSSSWVYCWGTRDEDAKDILFAGLAIKCCHQ